MTHASLCKKTYKNGLWFQGSITRVMRALGSFCFLALLFLASGNTALQAAQITVTSTALPSGLVGQAYMTQLTASGGTAPYSWFMGSLSGNQTGLPPGLQLNANGSGAITGTPTAAGTYTFPVTATDTSDDNPGSANLQIVIAPMAITTTFLPAGTTGDVLLCAASDQRRSGNHNMEHSM